MIIHNLFLCSNFVEHWHKWKYVLRVSQFFSHPHFRSIFLLWSLSCFLRVSFSSVSPFLSSVSLSLSLFFSLSLSQSVCTYIFFTHAQILKSLYLWLFSHWLRLPLTHMHTHTQSLYLLFFYLHHLSLNLSVSLSLRVFFPEVFISHFESLYFSHSHSFYILTWNIKKGNLLWISN